VAATAMVAKDHILNEIKRTAASNGDVPLGVGRFYKETGIKASDWAGKYWARWGDALREAGYESNKMRGAYDDEFMITKLIALIRELGHFPVANEMRLKTRRDAKFPDRNTFRRLGSKAELINRVVEYGRRKPGFEDVIEICEPLRKTKSDASGSDVIQADEPEFGFVYLIKYGRYFKIGRSNAPGRREYELAIQLPEKATKIHEIRTDDPAGIEGYWHRRFADKRRGGEFFELTSSDVQAFKRRKFM
jgi:Meiotically up-regulated gene 113